MNIKHLAALFGGSSYREIARRVWPNGVEYRCRICGTQHEASSDDAAKHLKDDDWPTHCGFPMDVSPAGEELYALETATGQNKRLKD